MSRLSEIPQKTLTRWLVNLSQNKLVKGLESLQGKALHLSHKILKRGGKVKAVKAEIAFEILEFAAFDLGKKQARQALRACGAIGLNSFIQAKTGWLPEEFQSSKEARDCIDQIIQELPRAWELHFNKLW